MSLQEKYRGFVPEDLTPWHMWDQRFQRKDTFASILKPDDIPADLVPTKVTGDGNCLFNSASINLVGNEDLSVILRLLTAAELYLHANFYANHPRYNQPDMTMSEASKLMVSLSVDISNGRDRLVALRQQAMSTCKNKQWAGLVEMMALSTVTRNTVYSVYPNASPAMRPLFHGLIEPRIAQDASCSSICYIMWS
ncbi:hypothetical protein OS493_019320 [Desmophyllum pertusum]|uniref:Vertnin n=1 Tax=Desmophyllum pertusum TaxID=174260 RepID=A0A9X0A1P1_9CNID|nr:hypothetical protein OS493_019320 [Desmophyllum pertusum]